MVKSIAKRVFNVNALLWLFIVVAGLLLGWYYFPFLEISEPFYTQCYHKTIDRIEHDLQAFKSNLVQQPDLPAVLADPQERYNAFVNHSCILYDRDSLCFWNTNVVEPRVVHKRVPVPCDTILNFNNVSYVISTTQAYGYSVYLLDALPVSPHSEHASLPYVCLVVILFCAYLLCSRWITKKTSPPVSPTYASRQGIWIPLAATLVLVVLLILSFKALCHSFFVNGFIIPQAMRFDRHFLYLFLFLLALLTLLLLLKRLYLRFFTSSVRNELFLMVFQLFLVSLLLTYLYDREYTRFENRQVKSLAFELADERDPEFEASYHRFLAVAPHDTTFFTTLLTEDVMEAVAEDYLRSFLFDSVMNQYNVAATLCSPGMELEVQPYNVVTECNEYFLSKVMANHGLDLDDGLYFIDYNTLDPSYLANFNFMIGDSISDRIVYLEFTKPVVPQGFGLPKMLQSNNSMLPLDYSVACYQDSLLVYKYGSYVYPNFLTNYRHNPDDFYYSSKMKHFTYYQDSKVIAITLPRRDWKQLTSPFAVFFLILLVLFLFVYYVGGVRRHYPSLHTLSNQFQVLVLVALGVSFLLVGPFSVVYMRTFYNEKEQDYQFERIRTLLMDITGEVDFSFLKQPGFKYELDKVLRHYSETFFTDINLYGLDGKMLATTCPELLDMHLQSSMMNAEAFMNMQGQRSLYYIHDEHLGKIVYQSAYMPIQDENGKNLAYLNTPYVASQSELHSDLLNYILTYINIMLLIIFVILYLVLRRTRKLTDPMLQLQKKMQEVDINKQNELLEWKSDDEIGELVHQYNQLVLELEKSAAELRRTTTESAWRGVARQVAHEIKNSLTPMRLSVQLLQRNVDKGNITQEQIQRTTNTLIEQIDALSDIASSFSTYAKLPENHPQPFNLAELVENLVNLYDNEDNIEFRYECDPDRDFTYIGDKTNMNSAVGNIIKNAVQAIGNAANGLITVKLQEIRNCFVISVKDNGKGIKEEDKDMIFLPNFTTKSSGSGVGLSLTYNIVKAAGGTIQFDSKEGEGAEFVIELPKS